MIDIVLDCIVGQPHHGRGVHRAGEFIACDQNARNRAANEACDDQTERRGRDADFQGILQAEARRDQRRPRYCCAVTANERGRSEKHRHSFRQIEDFRTACRNEVLNYEINERERQQNRERPASGDQIAEFCVEADPGEEVEEQHVSRVEVENNLPAQRLVRKQRDQCREQAAGDRLGNVPPPKGRDQIIEPPAHKEHDNRNGERKQAWRFERRHRVHSMGEKSTWDARPKVAKLSHATETQIL